MRVLDRTFQIRASGRCSSPAVVLRQIAECQGVTPDAGSLDHAVEARIDAVARDVTLRPEAVPVLAAVRARGLRTGVVSDCWYELPAFFPALAVAPLLDASAFSIDVGHCKPHPAIYRSVCERLAVAPRRCMYVGDGGGRELTGARGVGMAAVRLAAWDLGGHLSFDVERDWAGASVTELTDVLSFLSEGPV